MIKLIIIPLTFLFLASCSFAPLNSTKSASSLGKGKWLIETGLSPAIFVRAERGFTENFDLGLNFESQFKGVFTLTSKYSFINNPQGFSVSAIGAFFSSSSTKGYYVGPIVGYRLSWFETYFSARFNSLKYDDVKLSSNEYEDSLITELTIDGGDLSYMQYNLGFNFWLKETFGINLNLLALSSPDSYGDIEDSTTYGFSFIWKI